MTYPGILNLSEKELLWQYAGIWCLGIALYELITSNLPSQNFYTTYDIKLLETDNIPKCLITIIRGCLKYYYQDRYKIDEILNSDFIIKSKSFIHSIDKNITEENILNEYFDNYVIDIGLDADLKNDFILDNFLNFETGSSQNVQVEKPDLIKRKYLSDAISEYNKFIKNI